MWNIPLLIDIINLKNTNIAYVKPHILKVKDNDYLIVKMSL